MLQTKGAHKDQKTMKQEEEFLKTHAEPPHITTEVQHDGVESLTGFVSFQIQTTTTCAECKILSKVGGEHKGILASIPLC